MGKPVPCPICGQLSRLDEPPVGVFCSPRCKLIDLGRWLGEDYRVSEDLRPDHFLELKVADLPPDDE